MSGTLLPAHSCLDNTVSEMDSPAPAGQRLADRESESSARTSPAAGTGALSRWRAKQEQRVAPARGDARRATQLAGFVRQQLPTDESYADSMAAVRSSLAALNPPTVGDEPAPEIPDGTSVRTPKTQATLANERREQEEALRAKAASHRPLSH
jgi:hypothetical protein